MGDLPAFSWGVSLITFVFGAIVGSFLNVVILRYNTKQSPLHGRSECPYCHTTLAPLEMIPLFSYFLQLGRCQHCHHQLSLQYPLVEFVCGFGTAAILAAASIQLPSIILLFLFWTAIVIFAIDIRQLIIPDRAVIGLLILAVLWRFTQLPVASFDDAMLGLLMTGGLLSLLIILTRGQGMGWGDAKLAAVLGLLLGFRLSVVLLLSAFILGSIVGIGLMLMHKAKWRGALPFAPFLLLGATLAMIWGDPLATWLGLLGPAIKL